MMDFLHFYRGAGVGEVFLSDSIAGGVETQTRNARRRGGRGWQWFSTAKVKRDAAAAGLKVTSSTPLAAAGHDGEQGESLLHY